MLGECSWRIGVHISFKENGTHISPRDSPAFLALGPFPPIRHNGWNPQKQRGFCKMLAESGRVDRAAHAVRMGIPLDQCRKVGLIRDGQGSASGEHDAHTAPPIGERLWEHEPFAK